MPAERLGERLRAIVARFDSHGETGPVRLVASRPQIGWHWFSEGADRPYLMGRATSMATTAIALQLVDEGLLDLDAPISRYVPAGMIAGLHVVEGVDRAEQLTMRLLLSHATGLPDYMSDRLPSGGLAAADALREDRPWTLEDSLEATRRFPRPLFLPGAAGRAHYSDLNARLAGLVVERITGSGFDSLVTARIADPLDLESTFVFGPTTMHRYGTIDRLVLRDAKPEIPHFLASMQAQGGLVSTAAEQLTFVRAFFGGRLFNMRHLEGVQSTWRQLVGPVRYGMGVMRYTPSRASSPFTALPAMVGHGGSTGAFTYHVPQMGLFVAGTLNQASSRSLTYSMLTRAVVAIRRTPVEFIGDGTPVRAG